MKEFLQKIKQLRIYISQNGMLKKIIPCVIMALSVITLITIFILHEKKEKDELNKYKQIAQTQSQEQEAKQPVITITDNAEPKSQYIVVKKKQPTPTPTPTPAPKKEKESEEDGSEDIEETTDDKPDNTDEEKSEPKNWQDIADEKHGDTNKQTDIPETQQDQPQQKEQKEPEPEEVYYGPVSENYYLVYMESQTNHSGYVNLYSPAGKSRDVLSDVDFSPRIVSYSDYLNIWDYYTRDIDDSDARAPYDDVNSNYIIFVKYSNSESVSPGIKSIDIVDRDGELDFYLWEKSNGNDTPHGSGYIVAIPTDVDADTPVNLKYR